MNMPPLFNRFKGRRVLACACVLLASSSLLMADFADARGRGGGGRGGGGAAARGGGGGGMARSSVSGANRASAGSMNRSQPSRQPAQRPANPQRGNGYAGGGAQRPNAPAGAQRPNQGGGNRVNTGDINRGDGNRINTGDNNFNRNTNIDVDHDGWGGWSDVDVDIDGGPGDWDIDVDVDHYHPLATAAAIATTAAVVGSYYYSVPYGCPVVNTYAVPYYYCGGVYYEQRMQGDDVVYVVVQP